MGFKTGDFPPVDVETFLDKPLMERVRILGQHWAEYGFGSPKILHTIYIAKLVVFYMLVGTLLASLTSGLGPIWQISDWWLEPVFYQKAILWTVLLETVGVCGSWGPLAGHFKPMTGGILFWARPETIRLPPWPGKVPFTAGDRRTVFDVVLYLAILVNLLWALLAPGVPSASMSAVLPNAHGGIIEPALMFPLVALYIVMGLRDKVVFIAARSEQYLPAMVFFGTLGFVDMIIALKLLIVSVWMGAGVSKFGRHFANVVPPMVSNTPWIGSKALKRAHYRNFPDDLRPSHIGSGLAHIGGTTVELVTPMILLFSTNSTLTLCAVGLMILFHLFIISTFPLAVPLEWNVLFGFAAAFLFVGFPVTAGYGITDMSSPWLTVAIVVGLVFFPVLGNLRPDLVSFLPSMRQYAGNWASAMWAFAPGCEQKLNEHIVRSSLNQVDQLALTYPKEIAEITMQQTIGWRSLHSQGRALFSLMMNHLGEDLDRYTVREAEFACNSIVAFNFGDGHLHGHLRNHHLIDAIQRRCNFAPGEFVIAWIESQPIHRQRQDYVVIDAALGVIERGSFSVKDAVNEQPWLPNGPIPFKVDWTRPTPAAEPSVASDAGSEQLA
ncbi:DUF3556 domain-containing protein [Pseudonocardia spinosispora]|uniref:DUF3556 domain-containing protein n=1 Tax=Pseudonocardia spinosispora TaxID=103441 RepID=UPI0003FBA706|nr:DUF3556 domain-containing protein [Pseudonocardia spinosispora]